MSIFLRGNNKTRYAESHRVANLARLAFGMTGRSLQEVQCLITFCLRVMIMGTIPIWITTPDMTVVAKMKMTTTKTSLLVTSSAVTAESVPTSTDVPNILE
jgi:hypothetical protein